MVKFGRFALSIADAIADMPRGDSRKAAGKSRDFADSTAGTPANAPARQRCWVTQAFGAVRHPRFENQDNEQN